MWKHGRPTPVAIAAQGATFQGPTSSNQLAGLPKKRAGDRVARPGLNAPPDHRELLASLDMSFGRAFALVAVILGLIAIVLGVVCGVITLRTRAFLAESTSVSGEVIGLVSRESCDKDDDGHRSCTTVYAPRIRFTTADGREIVFVSDTASSPASYSEGDRVTVRYRPEEPTNARLDTVTGIWLSAIITGGLALFFAVFSGIWIALAIRFKDA